MQEQRKREKRGGKKKEGGEKRKGDALYPPKLPSIYTQLISNSLPSKKSIFTFWWLLLMVATSNHHFLNNPSFPSFTSVPHLLPASFPVPAFLPASVPCCYTFKHSTLINLLFSLNFHPISPSIFGGANSYINPPTLTQNPHHITFFPFHSSLPHSTPIFLLATEQAQQCRN